MSVIFLYLSAARGLILALVLTASGVGMLPAITWTLQNGTTKSGGFVRLTDRELVIWQKEGELSILIEALSDGSLKLAERLDRSIRMKFARVEAGRFDMGIHKDILSNAEKNIAFILEDEPHRPAEVTRPFEIKATEVTWSEWNKVREHAGKLKYPDIAEGRNGYQGDDSGNHPVTEVSWLDAVKWCNLLSEIENLKPCYFTATPFARETVLRAGENRDVLVDWTAAGYRLPTEAEWEYALQARGTAKGFERLDGWYLENSEANTHPVKTRPSETSKDVHDMLGNVAEWCWDWKGPVDTGFHKDPRGPENGPHRVFRGGSWADPPVCCRGTYRGDFSPVIPRSVFVGFRPLRLYANPPKSR